MRDFPSKVIARNPNGIADPAPSATTTWYTDAKPAEIASSIWSRRGKPHRLRS